MGIIGASCCRRCVLCAGIKRISYLSHGGVRGEFLPTVTEISTGTGPTDIIHNIASKQDGLRAPKSAPLPENMPRGPLAPCAPSTSGAPSGRERARALHGRAPDPRADHTSGSRCPRRCAPCSRTRRCARALSCDRGSTRSASGRRYRRATRWPLCGHMQRAAAGLRCRACSGGGAGSAGPAARPYAGRTRYFTFTHTGSPAPR